MHIPFRSRVGILIRIPVSELHYSHSHSHWIPTGKWETEILIPNFPTQNSSDKANSDQRLIKRSDVSSLTLSESSLLSQGYETEMRSASVCRIAMSGRC